MSKKKVLRIVTNKRLADHNLIEMLEYLSMEAEAGEVHSLGAVVLCRGSRVETYWRCHHPEADYFALTGALDNLKSRIHREIEDSEESPGDFVPIQALLNVVFRREEGKSILETCIFSDFTKNYTAYQFGRLLSQIADAFAYQNEVPKADVLRGLRTHWKDGRCWSTPESESKAPLEKNLRA